MNGHARFPPMPGIAFGYHSSYVANRFSRYCGGEARAISLADGHLVSIPAWVGRGVHLCRCSRTAATFPIDQSQPYEPSHLIKSGV